MNWIVGNIGWILVVSGAATFSMIGMAVAPRFAMRFLFGAIAEGPVADLVARSWGAMIAASGLMLIYAAAHDEVRRPILLFSILGKLGFIVLVAVEPRFRRSRAVAAASGDLVIVMLLAGYLLVT